MKNAPPRSILMRSIFFAIALLASAVRAETPAEEVDPDVLRKVRKLIQATLSEETADREKAWTELTSMGNLAVPGLAALYKQKSTTPGMTQSILLALGDSKDKRAGPVLMTIFQSSEKTVRRDAARALGDSGFKDALPALESSAANIQEDEDVRLFAAVAGAKMGSEKAIASLKQLLDSAKPETRSRAVFALGKYGGTQQLDAIQGALKDKDASVREDAIAALRNLGKDALGGLVLGVSDADYKIRGAAMDALRAVSGEKIGNNPEAWQAWWKKKSAAGAE